MVMSRDCYSNMGIEQRTKQESCGKEDRRKTEGLGREETDREGQGERDALPADANIPWMLFKHEGRGESKPGKKRVWEKDEQRKTRDRGKARKRRCLYRRWSLAMLLLAAHWPSSVWARGVAAPPQRTFRSLGRSFAAHGIDLCKAWPIRRPQSRGMDLLQPLTEEAPHTRFALQSVSWVRSCFAKALERRSTQQAW